MKSAVPNDSEAQFLHDLSTPVSVILFQVEALLSMDLSEDAKKRLEKVQEQSRKIADLIEAHR